MVGAHPEVHPSARPLRFHEARFVQCLEVMADGWLRDAPRLDEVTRGARLTLSCDQTEQPEAGRIGEGPEPCVQSISFRRRKWLGEKWSAAYGDKPA